MAIDFLTKKKESEESLASLVKDRDIEDELSTISKNLSNLRNRFAERSEALISSVSPVGRSSVFQRLPEISSQTERMLAKRKLSMQRQKAEMIFNNAFELAQQYGMDERQAIEYARKIRDQELSQEFEGSEAEKLREYKRRINELAEQYGRSSQELFSEFAPSRDILPQFLGSALATGSEVFFDRYLRNRYERQPSKRKLAFGEGTGITPFTVGASSRKFRPYTGDIDYSRITNPTLSRFGRF